MPELFIHLPPEVRVQLLMRVDELAQKHAYPEVRENMRDLLPVLQAIQADVQKQLAAPAKGQPVPKGLDLSAPPEAEKKKGM